MPRRRIVLVADDLGVSPGVNDGIGRAAAAGNVREASLCVTGAAVEDGVELAHRLGLEVGLHLSLTLGRALSGPMRGLTDTGGHFLGLGRLILASQLRTLDREALEGEIRAQLARLTALGITPSHLNGHHHVHVLPVVREVVFRVAAESGIRWTRMPAERAAGLAWPSPKLRYLAGLARHAAPRATAAGLRWLPFVGLCTEARSDFGARARRQIACLDSGDAEWMVHPRISDPTLEQLDRDGYRRPATAELAALTDPDLAAEFDFAAATFGEVAPPPHESGPR